MLCASGFMLSSLFELSLIHALLAVRRPSVLMVGSASGGLDTCHTGSASATAWAQYCLLALLVFARVVIGVVMGGGVISAAPRSLAGPARLAPRILSVRWYPPLGGGLVGGGISAAPESLAGPVRATAERWPNKGRSRPVLPDHGQLAASEQAQLEAARATSDCSRSSLKAASPPACAGSRP